MGIKKRDKTKIKLKTAYIHFIQFKRPFSVTVLEMCEFCGVNRSTFYEYYDCIGSLIEDVILDQLNTIERDVKSLYDEYYEEHLLNEANVKKYLEVFLKNEILLRLIKSADGNRFKTLIVNQGVFFELTKFNIRDKKERLNVIYRISGVFELVFLLIEKPNEYTIDEIANTLYEKIIS